MNITGVDMKFQNFNNMNGKKRIVVRSKGLFGKRDFKKLDDLEIYYIEGTINIDRDKSDRYGLSFGKEIFLKDVSDSLISGGVVTKCILNENKSAIKFSGMFLVKYKYQVDAFRNLELRNDDLKVTVHVYTVGNGQNTIPLRATSIEIIKIVTNKIQISS